MGEVKNIPKHWQVLKLGDVADYLNGRAFKPTEWEKEGAPIIRIQNLNKLEAIYNYTNKVFEDRYKIERGELLYAWSASLGAYIWNGDKAWLNQHIFKVVPRDFCDKKYLFYTLEKITAELYAKAHGSGMVHVTKGTFEETEIPLPPLPEQRAIVAKIEELLSDLDNGKQQLQIAQQQLKVYRQSLLKAAFEGKLSLDYDSCDLDDEHDFKNAATPHHGNHNNHINQSSDNLPKGWKWAKIADVAESMKNGLYKPADVYSVNGIACLRMYNIASGKILWFDIKRMNLDKIDIEEYGLKEGDLLVNRVNSRELVGKTAYINKYNEPVVYESKNIRLRLKETISGKYLNYWFLLSANKYFTSNAQQTVGMASINQQQISNFTFPLPSIREQHFIVTELESKLTVCDHIEETINHSLLQAESLRQGILKKAFEGKLVTAGEE